MVSARVIDDKVDVARSIVNQNRPVDVDVDVDGRCAMYREKGWERFNENSPDLTQAEIAREGQ
ncbi:MAG: hypothetical protein AAAC48_00535 [Phyllobacterium sp.]|uniref:hypothetical protein n=1 Tax=Phyllobacterium sp. TaxID=1871046 RepID=UPI0030F0FAC2